MATQKYKKGVIDIQMALEEYDKVKDSKNKKQKGEKE